MASTVSVLVIDCTRTGAPPPIVTTRRPSAPRAPGGRRAAGAMKSRAIRGLRIGVMQFTSGGPRRCARPPVSVTGWPRKFTLRRRGIADGELERRRAVDADRLARRSRRENVAPRIHHLDPGSRAHRSGTCRRRRARGAALALWHRAARVRNRAPSRSPPAAPAPVHDRHRRGSAVVDRRPVAADAGGRQRAWRPAATAPRRHEVHARGQQQDEQRRPTAA